jgi:hypothetical protein
VAKKLVTVSDLTGEVIEDGTSVVSIIVKQHPSIDRPVKLEAASTEIAALEQTSKTFVTLEILGRNREREQLTVDLRAFSKLFKQDPATVLDNAEGYHEAPVRRRGRPRGSVNKSTARSARPARQIAAVRDWARENGYQISDRGRISAEIQQAYSNAH